MFLSSVQDLKEKPTHTFGLLGTDERYSQMGNTGTLFSETGKKERATNDNSIEGIRQ
jgi:hypothetical protein